ncbi:MarR family transcriptional regulator [Streptomyces sp. NPDC029004]|uniref:MarR family transcriptional regulator n=1 Tax=Streptomyces sp. NPDC029004 TaxID=3154490 RepID=UPI0033C000EE
MPDIRESLHRAGQGVLSLALAQCRAAGSTMVLRVCGRPGGVFHLRQGSVVAVESPGAPGIETLLLRSGRISEADWAELVPAGRESRRPVAELATRGHIGAAELQVVSAMALQDAVFAVLAGDMGDCLADPDSGPLVPVGPGEDPLRLFDDAVRKLAALAAMPHAVLPDRERVVVRRGVDGPAEDLAPHRKEILYLADGRRTPRDIAFMIGRGVYHVTVEISRMLAEGLLERVARSAGTGVPRVWATQAPMPRRPAVAPHGGDATGELPRRTPGASGITEKTLAADVSATSWKGLFRFRSRTRTANSGVADS